MEKEVVSNSSSIIFLAKLNIFDLARNVFSRIIVPKAVTKELFEKDSPENEIVKRELNNFLKESEVKNIKDFPLDEGEKAAISLCLEKNVGIFLSDDKKARRYAKSLGIKVIGILGILLDNIQEKKIDKKEFLRLLNKLIEKGYYISPALYAEVMKKIEELQ
ncbi:MAG: DUF3368 domain-containing protein [Nanoarchaeota archaeon]|nr:DUF3368 domain-containing protein [Nanoarchaeota archaeon]